MEFILKLTLLISEIVVLGLAITQVLYKKEKREFEDYDIMAIGTLVFSLLAFTAYAFGIFEHFEVILHVLAGCCLGFITYFVFGKRFRVPEITIDLKYGIVMLFILGVAIFLRTPVANFIPMVGDAGEYVNTANQLAVGGSGESIFLPMAKVLLAAFSQILGSINIGSSNLLFSIFTLISFWRLFKAVFRKKLAILGLFLLSINILSMYLSRIQYSEVFMLFFNVNILIYYFKFFKNKSLFNSGMIGLFTMLACLTRITGLIWVIVLILNTIYQVVFVQKYIKKFWVLSIVVLGCYLISLGYGLTFFSQVYQAYMGSYISGIGVRGIGLLNLGLLIFINLIYALSSIIKKKFKGLPDAITQLGEKIRSNNRFLLLNIAVLAGIILLGVGILMIGIDQKFIDRFFNELPSGGIFSKIYGGMMRVNLLYLVVNYFTPLFVLILPVSIFMFYRKSNLFEHNKYTVLWFFSIIALTYYNFYRFTPRDHLFYMYWERYSYSELFIVISILFVGIYALWDKKQLIYKILLGFLTLAYVAQSGFWFIRNYNFEFLDNSYEMLAVIDSQIQEDNSIILVNSDPDADFYYPNSERIFLHPLHLSFGVNIHRTGEVSDNAHADDPRLDLSTVEDYTQDGYRVYVLNISDQDDFDFCTNHSCQTVQTEDIDDINYKIPLKQHYFMNVFHSEVEEYSFYVDIEKVE